MKVEKNLKSVVENKNKKIGENIMGTNKSKVINSIKNIVDNKPIDEVKENFSEISSKITGNFITGQLSQTNFNEIVGVVNGRIKKSKENFSILKDDESKKEKWISEILDLIDNIDDFKMSNLLEKALKISLVDVINIDGNEHDFIYALFYNITKLSLSEQLTGAFEHIDEGMTISEINETFINPIVDKVFDKNIRNSISEVIEGKTNIKEVNELIMRTVKNFGEF